MKIFYLINHFIYLIVIITSCTPTSDRSSTPKTVFSAIPDSETGIAFINVISENDSLSYFQFPYIYMGGGVAIGDINNDGLSDIFFTGNMVSNKLYLNKGHMQFQDISISANVQGDDRWYTGVTLTDINSDGWLDIYVSVSGKYGDTKNQLYINNGDLTFTEQAAKYGIADASNSIQSTFFDYDQDGDIDLFVANYPLVPISQGNMFYDEKMKENLPNESGHLYRNDGNEHFTDITAEAGVQNFGLTLGLIASDFNNDGWTDLYLSNDFNVPDYFYINNQDGTFKEVIKESTGHTSMFGMGIDASDFNNDGNIDLIQADMSPEDYVRAKVNMASMSPRTFNEGVELGFHHQYMQNSLQVNNGSNAEGIPVFSEISRQASMASTDWSWSTVFADLDNDGLKDIYITNGMKRDVNDNDVNKKTKPTNFKQAFSISISDYKSEPIANYVYQNQDNFKFENKAKDWNLNFKGFSNGMSYGDLDNDGDLDLVINNIDQSASLFQNETTDTNYLRVSLNGSKNNRLGLGAKVTLKSTKNTQILEQTLTRGFQSSIDPVLHFGLGKEKPVRLHVVWADGKAQVLENPTLNSLILLDYANAQDTIQKTEKNIMAFSDITNRSGIDFIHHEDLFDDYKFEPLLPYKLSMMGPALASADINNDGLEDFYVGNAGGEPSRLYMQIQEGQFEMVTGPWSSDKDQEDAAAVFADFDNDGDQDLYVVTHGNQFQDQTNRLYINTTDGFVKSIIALPQGALASKAVAATDFDKDGRIDLFIGGRNISGKYPFPASSQLLRNKGGKDEMLKFENVTSSLAEELKDIGMVTNAEWTDLDGDSWPELVLSGEWMPITIFKNKKGKLVNETKKYGLSKLMGWWYSVKSLDVDNDGDLDLIAGNLGINHKYQASETSPFEVYAADFDENGTNDIVLSYNKGEKEVPLRGRECSSLQVPAIGKRYETYRSFAMADLKDIYGTYMLKKALHYEVNTFAHYWFENENGRYTKQHLLPANTQFSCINAIVPFDYNGDDFPDLFMAGNQYAAEVETPRSDAGLGMVLTGSANGFEVVPPLETGLFFRGDIKHVVTLQLANGDLGFLLGNNDGALKLIQFKEPKSAKESNRTIAASAK